MKLQLGVGTLQQPLWSQSLQSLLTAKHRSVSFQFGVPHRAAPAWGERGHPAVVSGEQGPTTG